MRNYRMGNGSLLAKGILLIVGLVALAAIAKTIVTIAISVLFLAALAVGIWALVRFFGRGPTRPY